MVFSRLIRSCFAALLSCSSLLVAAQVVRPAAPVTIIPASPKAQDVVRVNMPTFNESIVQTSVSMTANTITIDMVSSPWTWDWGPNPPSAPLDVVVGQLPAGDYRVQVMRHLQGSSDGVLAGSTAFSVMPRASSDPPYDLTDLWWDPLESGWGLNIVEHPSGTIFATWFTYDPDQSPAWYFVPTGQWLSNPNGGPPNTYVGPIYRAMGPMLGQTFDPSQVTRTLVGQAQFTFYQQDGLTAQFTIYGKTITKGLTRQSF